MKQKLLRLNNTSWLRDETKTAPIFPPPDIIAAAVTHTVAMAGLSTRNLDTLTLSRPLSQSLDLPVCLARFPTARLWLKEESLEDSGNLPNPDIIAAEIVEDLQAALSQFAERSERDERHGRQSDEGRSERARAANEFQIATDLKR
jgi:hypothetical protein